MSYTTTLYDNLYLDDNYFRHRQWLYTPYINTLVSYCRLAPGSFILDVGCGQGFFSDLFRTCGMIVHGIDLSEVGIRAAITRYGRDGLTFTATDLTMASFPHKFHAIFVRSCSLYNTDDFSRRHDVTHHLLTHLKKGGVLIFAHNTNFSGKHSPAWRYHSLRDLAEHFREYSHKEIFFSTKLDTYFLKRLAFTSVVTRLNVLLSRISGVGGDAICILSPTPQELALPRVTTNTRCNNIFSGSESRAKD